MMGLESHNFTSQQLRLHYVDWGNPEAPLLILLHGSRDHCRSWDSTAEKLRGNWHVIAPDLRGHGDSAWSGESRYDFAAYVYDLAQLVYHLGDGPTTIIGHSLGAHIGLRYAGLYPDRVSGLVAIEAVGSPPAIEAERGNLSTGEAMRRWILEKRAASGLSPRRYPSFEDALIRMRAENRALTDAQVHHLTSHGTRRNEDGSWSWKFDNQLRKIYPFPDFPETDVTALWRQIDCPTLLIYGTESWRSDVPDRLIGTLSDVRVAAVDNAGHWLQHERFDRYISLVTDFFRSTGPC